MRSVVRGGLALGLLFFAASAHALEEKRAYFGVNANVSFAHDNFGTSYSQVGRDDLISAQYTYGAFIDYRHKSGAGASFEMGYISASGDLMSGFELLYHGYTARSIDSPDIEMDIDTAFVFLSATYFLNGDLLGKITPYVGGSIGAGYVEVSGDYTLDELHATTGPLPPDPNSYLSTVEYPKGVFENANEMGFGVQLRGGVALSIARDSFIGVGVKYFAMATLKDLDDISSSTGDAMVQLQSVTEDVTVSFTDDTLKMGHVKYADFSFELNIKIAFDL